MLDKFLEIRARFRGKKPTVCDHESADDRVEHKSELHILNSKSWQILVELTGSGIILQEKEFVDPVENTIEQTSEWIQNWQSNGVGHHTEQVSVILSVDIMTRYLVARVERIQISLHEKLGVDIIIIFTCFFIL